MADVFSPEKRSEVMSLIRGRDTKPELALRSMLHLPGLPMAMEDDGRRIKITGTPHNFGGGFYDNPSLNFSLRVEPVWC